MSYLTYNDKMLTFNDKYLTYVPSVTSTPQLEFQLSLIRNQQMNNAIGDRGSIDLSINSITGLVLSIPNLPTYSGFYKEASTWAIVPTYGLHTQQPVFCTSINDIAKTVTIKDSSIRFEVGTKVALYNPFLNYSFTGNQTSRGSINPTDLTGWGSIYVAAGPLFKVGSTFKWLFAGLSTGPPVYNQIGLATSTDLSTWTIQNNGGPWWPRSVFDASTVATAGDITQIDSSYYCTIGMVNASTLVNEVKNIYFDQDVSNLVIGNTLVNNAAPGSIAKIGSEYHMLYMDLSTGSSKRNIRAAKSSSLEGPFTTYQINIIATFNASIGQSWSQEIAAPTIHNINGYVFGLVSGSTTYYSAGIGNANTEYILLDFDSSTQIWSVSTKGSVLLNPLDWGGMSSDYNWAVDHSGQAQGICIDGSSAYISGSFNNGGNTYQASMTKLKNFTL